MNPPARLWLSLSLWRYQKAKGLEYTRKNGSTSALPLLPIYPKTTTATHTRRILRLPPTTVWLFMRTIMMIMTGKLCQKFWTSTLRLSQSLIRQFISQLLLPQNVKKFKQTTKLQSIHASPGPVHITSFWSSTFPFIYIDPARTYLDNKGLCTHTHVRGEST